MSKLKIFNGKKILYRKMSLTEYEGVIKNGFQIIAGVKNDYRKWLSDSLVAAARFKNPYFNEEEIITKVHMNPDFFSHVAQIGIAFDKNQRHLFFQNHQILENDLIYCPAHIVTSAYINYGIRRKSLEIFNNNIDRIDQINLLNFSNDLMNELYGTTDFQSLVTGDYSLDDLEFYIQLPSDLAILSLKHNCIFTEGLNSIIASRFLSKQENIIDELNRNKLPALMKIKFNPSFIGTKYHSQFINNGVIELSIKDILIINSMIQKLSLVKIDETKNTYNTPKRYIGNNSYKIHETKKLQRNKLVPLSKENLNKLKALLNRDINIGELVKIIPIFKDCIDCGQIKPAHIYDVSQHIILSIRAIDDIIKSFSSVNESFNFTSTDIDNMKLAMLLHDIGKPYCDTSKTIDKYTQFREYMENSLLIGSELLKEANDSDVILTLMTMSKTNGKKTQNNYFADIIKMLDSKGLPKEEVLSFANKLVYQTFILKIANYSTMQREKFNSNFKSCLDFLKNWEEYKLKRLKLIDESINFKDLENLYGELLETIVIGSSQKNINESIISTTPILHSILSMHFDDSTISNDYCIKSNKYKNFFGYKQMELSEAIEMINGSENSDLLFDKIRNVRYDLLTGDKIHGLPHNEKVAMFTFIMGTIYECNREELDILLEAAYYHDVGRIFEKSESLHGKKSAQIYSEEKMCSHDRKNRIIMFIMEGHSLNDSELDDLLIEYRLKDFEDISLKLIRILKDADALDLVRLTMNSFHSKLNPDLFRNSAPLNMLKLSHQINEVYYKQFNKIASSSYQKRLN